MRGLWLDQRIGGLPRWVLCDDLALMQIPPELRRCVCFTYAERPTEPRVGSAFILGIPLKVPSVPHAFASYIVTAKHCVQSTDEFGDFQSVGLRLNTLAGGSDYIWTNPDDWRKHPTADVAMLPLAPDQAVFDWLPWPVVDLATSDFLRSYGPGEDVLITGLLVNHPGETRILPIVRVGNIAAYPEEPISLVTGDDVVALVEVRSIGGLSGSPAFLHPGDVRTGGGNVSVGVSGVAGGPNYLMGLVHGFYPVAENDPDGVTARSDEEDINTGISVVVLADRILDLINDPKEQAVRDETTKNLQRRGMPKPATGAASSSLSDLKATADLMGKLLQVPKDEADEVHRRHDQS